MQFELLPVKPKVELKNMYKTYVNGVVHSVVIVRPLVTTRTCMLVSLLVNETSSYVRQAPAAIVFKILVVAEARNPWSMR